MAEAGVIEHEAVAVDGGGFAGGPDGGAGDLEGRAVLGRDVGGGAAHEAEGDHVGLGEGRGDQAAADAAMLGAFADGVDGRVVGAPWRRPRRCRG